MILLIVSLDQKKWNLNIFDNQKKNTHKIIEN